MNAIICIGDSITFGRGEQPTIGWVGRLKEWWEQKDPYNAVYNLGIPGDTSKGVLNRIQTQLQARVRQIRDEDTFHIILAIGTNDLRRVEGEYITPPEAFRKNILQIITHITSIADSYTVLSIPPVHTTLAKSWEDAQFCNEDVEEYNKIVKELTKEQFVQLNIPNNWDQYIPDGIHPNSQGYEQMFAQIKRNLNTRLKQK